MLTLNQGLLYLLDVDTSVAVQVILLLVAAIGVGALFPVPLIGKIVSLSNPLLMSHPPSSASSDASEGHGH